MKQRRRKERFYIDVADAVFMNNMKSFIDMETLEIDRYDEPALDFEDDEDEVGTEDPVNSPDKYFAIEQLKPWQSFKITENFFGGINQ